MSDHDIHNEACGCWHYPPSVTVTDPQYAALACGCNPPNTTCLGHAGYSPQQDAPQQEGITEGCRCGDSLDYCPVHHRCTACLAPEPQPTPQQDAPSDEAERAYQSDFEEAWDDQPDQPASYRNSHTAKGAAWAWYRRGATFGKERGRAEEREEVEKAWDTIYALRAENARLREGLMKQSREHPNGCVAWTRECEAKLAAAEREIAEMKAAHLRATVVDIGLVEKAIAAEQREKRLREAIEGIIGISALPVDHQRPIEHSCCAVAEKVLEIGAAALAEGEK